MTPIPRDLLQALQNPDGGWPAAPRGPSSTEATALALLALQGRDDAAPAVERARRWLRVRQRADGSWPPQDAVPLGSWMTALAALALSGHPADRGAARAGGRWLLARGGRRYPWWTRVLLAAFPGRAPVRLDPDLVGWPWSDGTFSWVEPTAYALLALERLQSLLPADPTRRRRRMGERLILDRTCPGGGWNYGNSVVLGEELWPYPDTTALALLALQGVAQDPRVFRSRAVLRLQVERRSSALALALAVLALEAHAEDVVPLRARLARRLDLAPPADTRSLAFAALALDSGPPPFRRAAS